jgi:hypothetical protein
MNNKSENQNFPWPSAISLLYPAAAVVYISTQTPAPTQWVIGYGVANTGYLLIAAGIIKGTFGIFRLKKRWQVLLAGALAFLIGTIMSNT